MMLGPEHLYPVIIWRARYTGMYEGDEWVALFGEDAVPPEAIGDDIECSEWFYRAYETDTPLIAAGPTPNDALRALVEKARSLCAAGKHVDEFVVYPPLVDKPRRGCLVCGWQTEIVDDDTEAYPGRS
jgi:hypothetical protein